MKKSISILLTLCFLLIPKNALALTANLSCNSSGSVALGNTITVTITGNASSLAYWEGVLDYDSSKLSKVSGEVRAFTDTSSKNPSFTYTFKAIGEGSAYVKMTGMNVSDENGNELNGLNSTACNISIVQPSSSSNSSNSGSSSSNGGSSTSSNSGSSSSGSNSSSNNNNEQKSDNSLKSLTIDGIELSPAFNKDVLEYSATVPEGTTSIKIGGSESDSSASISGLGEHTLTPGINKIKVVVKAENGATRTYTINVAVKEKNPIKVDIDKETDGTLMREITGLETPEGFEKTTVEINGEKVEAYRNSKLGFLLVGILDENNNPSYYIFDENKLTYTRYVEFTGASIKLILLEANEDDVPYKYRNCIFNIGDELVKGYELSSDSRFKLVYAMNKETLEKGFYLYDLDEKTFQRFYNEQVLIYIDLIQKCKIGIVVLAGLFAVLLMTVLCLFFVNHKTKNRINDYALEMKKNNEKLKKEKTFLDE